MNRHAISVSNVQIVTSISQEPDKPFGEGIQEEKNIQQYGKVLHEDLGEDSVEDWDRDCNDNWDRDCNEDWDKNCNDDWGSISIEDWDRDCSEDWDRDSIEDWDRNSIEDWDRDCNEDWDRNSIEDWDRDCNEDCDKECGQNAVKNDKRKHAKSTILENTQCVPAREEVKLFTYPGM
jgi:hypothetical protein